jgi:universal stress protein E
VDPVHERDKPAALDHAILDLALGLGERIESRVHAVHGYDPSPAFAVAGD